MLANALVELANVVYLLHFQTQDVQSGDRVPEQHRDLAVDGPDRGAENPRKGLMDVNNLVIRMSLHGKRILGFRWELLGQDKRPQNYPDTRHKGTNIQNDVD